MTKLLIALLMTAAVVPQEAAAFWRRSQVSFCSDATTESERVPHRCWELDPYMDPGWPALGLGAGAAIQPSGARAPGYPAVRKGVTRRLG